jgi:uncharacterized protein YndB with AHSA1/START domain
MASNKERRVDKEIDGSPDEVYRALTDPSEFKIWDPLRIISDFRPGGRMTWRIGGNEGGIALVQVDPGRGWTGDYNFVPGQKVRAGVELAPTARGTRISLTIRDLPTNALGVGAYSSVKDGWSGWVEGLKAHVEVAKGRVLTKVVEDLRVATQTIEEKDVGHLTNRLGEVGPRVVEEVRAQNADGVGTVVVYHSREPWKVEVGCVLEGEVGSTKKMDVRTLEGGLVVAKPYTPRLYFPHTQTLFLHQGIERWSGQNGYKPTGPVREIYAANIWDQKTAVQGEVQLPVMREQPGWNERR